MTWRLGRRSGDRRRERVHALPGLLTATHQLFELCAGSGVIGQARVGLPPAACLSALLDAVWVAAALDERRDWERPLAAGAGAALAAPILHYTLFPWSLRWGIPVLVEAEGLKGRQLAGYNVVLFCWGAAGAAALMATPGRRRAWAVAGLLGAAAFRQLAQDHIVWIQDEARRNPSWWNRAWAGGTAA